MNPTDEDLTTSVLEYRKRIVENAELAQNLARENTQRAQQRIKDNYDRNARDPEFEVGQKVWVYTVELKKGPRRSCCITGWNHIGLLKSLHPFIFAYVLTLTRKSPLQSFMPIE